MFVFLAFSSFSSWVASFSLNFTQVVSHNAHISSHTTPLISQVTQLISHNSSHSTHLTQLNSLKSCFRVAFGGAASCSLTELHPSSFTQLISQLTTHLTQLLRFWVGQFCNWSWKSSACKCSTARKMMRLLCVCRHRNMNLINSPHPTGNWSWKSCACLCSTGRKMMRLLCLCVHRNMNVIIPPHPPTPPTPPTHATDVENVWG